VDFTEEKRRFKPQEFSNIMKSHTIKTSWCNEDRHLKI
jgi:hypothetical protein